MQTNLVLKNYLKSVLNILSLLLISPLVLCILLVIAGVDPINSSFTPFYLSYILVFLYLFYQVIRTKKLFYNKLLVVYNCLLLLSFIFSFKYADFYFSSIVLYINMITIPILWYSFLNISKDGLKNYLNFILLLPLLYILLSPVEYIYMERPTIMHLQFSGGQYHVYGLLLLFIFLDEIFNFLSKTQKVIVDVEIVLFGLISFSRTGILISLIYLLYILFVKKRIWNFKVILFLLIVMFLSYKYFDLLSSEYLNIVFTRFNIFSNYTSEFVAFSLEDNLDNDRFKIIKYILDRPISEMLFGSGLGSTRGFLNYISNGQYQYSSLHNLFVTSFLERGLLPTSLLLAMFLVFFLSTPANLHGLFKFFLLVFFAVTTGVELFMDGKLFDLNFTLLLVFALFLYEKSKRKFFFK